MKPLAKLRILLFACVTVSCTGKTPAEIMLVISSDLRVPEELDGLTISVSYQGTDRPQIDRSLSGEGSDVVQLPTTLGVVGGPDLTEAATITVTGKLGTKQVVSQRAVVSFIAGKVLALPIALTGSCAHRAGCDTALTCRDGSCVDPAIDAQTLAPFTKDQVPVADASVVDAHSGDGASADASQAHCSDGWCTIPAGSFGFGSPQSESCRSQIIHDVDQYTVTLSHSFLMAETEVTNSDFQQKMGYIPDDAHCADSKCPAVGATWNNAAAYCNKLSELAGLTACYTCSCPTSDCAVNPTNLRCDNASAYQGAAFYSCPGFRLPTEAEWEHAYRAGSTTALYNGNLTYCTTKGSTTKDPNAMKIGWHEGQGKTQAQPVKTLPTKDGQSRNAWGLYDMAGNVSEWCNDWYQFFYAEAARQWPKSDPWGAPTPTSPSDRNRIIRGGSYHSDPHELRAAGRDYENSDGAYSIDTGFRCVRTLNP